MQTRRYSTTETIIGLLVMAAVVIGIFTLFRTIYGILKWATPFLLVAAVIINYKVVVSFGKMIFSILTKNLVTGIIIILLMIFAFPLVAAVLLGLAIMNKKADNILNLEKQRREGIPTDYTEISSTPNNRYDDLVKK